MTWNSYSHSCIPGKSFGNDSRDFVPLGLITIESVCSMMVEEQEGGISTYALHAAKTGLKWIVFWQWVCIALTKMTAKRFGD